MRINVAYIFKDIMGYTVKSWVIAVAFSVCLKNGWLLPFIANQEVTYLKFLTTFFIFIVISVFLIIAKIKVGGYDYSIHKLLGSEKQ